MENGNGPASADPPRPGQARRRVLVHQDGRERQAEDWLLEEAPIELRYNGEPFAVMLATPSELEDLACGFSLSEGLVDDPGDIDDITLHERVAGFVVDIQARMATNAGSVDSRSLPGRSGCGLCGSRRLEDVLRVPPAVADGPVLEPGALQRALAALAERQPLNVDTGAAHAAAWVTPAGDIRCAREDVGRHNALDKLLGALLRGHADMRDGFVLVTSRASYEMVIKSARCGVGLLAAISAPTALAVGLAQSCRLTLVGFTRPGRHVVYSHPQRLP